MASAPKCVIIQPMSQKQKIVIVGGGFAGVKVALELADDQRFAITLVSDQDYFRYYPALYHTATGAPRRVSAIPISELLAGQRVSFVRARALKLDRQNKQISTKGAGKLSFDKLILAMGMTTNYFGIPGLDKYSYGIKSIDEVDRFKAHLHRQLQQTGQTDLHYLVVGGGPTGVELAAMLPGYLQKIAQNHGIARPKINVALIEAAPRILPRLPRDVARMTARRLRKLGVKIHTKQKVEAQTAEALVINGAPIGSRTVIWTAGVSCYPFFADNGFRMTEHHKVAVDEFLRAEPDIFVLGDNADTRYSGVAQTALYDAQFVADNLKRWASDQIPKVYQPKRPIYVTPTGEGWASVVWGKLRLYGRLGWLLREAADFIAYRDYQPWWPAAQRWWAMHTDEERCPICGNQPGE